LENVTFYHMHTNGPAPHCAPSAHGRFRAVSLFTGGPLREAVASGHADFVPVFLSDIPALGALIRKDAARGASDD
jgi:acyl-CoA hydrolase